MTQVGLKKFNLISLQTKNRRKIMKKIKIETSMILLLVSVLGIVSLVSFAQSENSDNFADNRNITRILRLVNSLNKEAEKQQAKGVEKRAEMLKNYFQKKTGISNEALLKLNDLAANFAKETENLNAQIKEIRKNQKNKPNDGALPSELAKLRESRNKLFDSARQFLNSEVAEDDSEKVLKFLREKIIGKSKRIDKSQVKKGLKENPNLNWFNEISYNELSVFEDEIEGYSIIDYNPDLGEIFAMAETTGRCETGGWDGEREFGCRGASVFSEIKNEVNEVLDEGGNDGAGDYTNVEFYAVEFEGQPLWSGQYCMYSQHGIETNNDYQWIYAESNDCVDVEISETPEIDILWNGNSIKNTTQEAIVGQKINLSVAVTGGTPTNLQWTIDGEKVKNYEVNYTDPDSFTTATVTELENEDLSQANVQFYWVDGDEGRQIQITATVNEIQYTATANFNVKRPITTMTAITSTVGLGNVSDPDAGTIFALHLGDYLTDPGIRFEANATLPSGVSGEIIWVQVANTNRTRKPVNESEQTLNGIGLDTQFPYEEPNVGETEDSPYQSLSVPCNYTSVSANDNFIMYLMFKPQISSGESIYVPLRKIDWSWSGTGTRGVSCSSWVLTNANPTTPQNLTSEETTEFPEWVANVTQFDFQ
jgi:hypothetical protein